MGLAGPNAKTKEIAPEQQAWVDGMLGQVRKVSAQKIATLAVPSPASSAIGDEDEEESVGRQQMQMHRNRFGYTGAPGGNVPNGPASMSGTVGGPGGAINDMGKAGNTRRVFVKRPSFGGAGNHGYQG